MKVQTALFFAALGSLTSGSLLHDELDGEHHNMDRRQASSAEFIPIGDGDRFEDGAKAPRGIGSSPKDFADDSSLAVLSRAGKDGEQKVYPCKNNKGNSQNSYSAGLAQEFCKGPAEAAHRDCKEGDKSCTDKVEQKAIDCIARTFFSMRNGTELRAWMKKDLDLIRQTAGLQSAMDADATLKFQLGDWFETTEQDLVGNFGDFNFEKRVQKRFKEFDDEPNVGFAKKADVNLNSQLLKTLAAAQKDILKTDDIRKVLPTTEDYRGLCPK